MKFTQEIVEALNSEVVLNTDSKIDDDNLKEQVNQLLQELNKLKVLKMRLIEKDAADYAEKRDKIREIFDDGDVIVSNVSNLIEKVSSVNLVNVIGGLANPTSTELMGSSFIDKMYDLAESILLRDKKPEERVKPAGFLAKLIKSPFISGILTSTPVGSIVNGIVGSLKTKANTILSENNLDDKVKKIKDIKLENKDAFSNKKIEEFAASLQNYIDLYDGLRIAGQKFENQLELLEVEVKGLDNQSSKFYKNFISELGLSDKNSTELERKYPSNIPKQYSELVARLTDEKFLASYTKYEDYLEIKFRVNKLGSDFKIALNTYVEKTKVILKAFAKTQDKSVKDKIADKITELELRAKAV